MQTFAPIPERSNSRLSSKRIFGLIKTELALVETEFESQASSNIQVIDYLGDYLRSSGGKRVRPALLILANYAVGGTGTNDNVIRLATVMEMLHTATLVHDDIIQNSHRPSAGPHCCKCSVNSRGAIVQRRNILLQTFDFRLRRA